MSIVTIAKDNPQGLLRTIKSVQEQDVDSWRLIMVIPRDSTETQSIAQSHLNPPKVILLEDLGIGIYEAMNLAIGMLETKYAWFLNAGDTFWSSSSLRIGLNVAEEKGADLIIGRHSVFGKSESIKKNIHRRRGKVGKFRFAFNRKSGCHQAMIFNSAKILSLGSYKTEYRLAADFDLVLRMVKEKNSYWTSSMLAIVEPGGVADMNLRKVFQEKHEIRRKAFNGKLITTLSLVWNVLAIAKNIIAGNQNFRARK